MFVRFQAVRARRYPSQVLTEHLMPEACRLQPIFLSGKGADAIRAFMKANGCVVHF